MIEPLNGIKLSFAIPTVFGDELSFSEFLGKVQEKLNEVIAEQNTLGETVKDLSSTVSQNKTETDAKISNIEVTITANKQDADGKITALTATVAANKQDADGKITALTATVAANKQDADEKLSALQTKTTPRSLFFRTGVNGFILFSKNEDELYTGLTFTTDSKDIPHFVTLGIYNISFSSAGSPMSYTPVKVSTFTAEIVTPTDEKVPNILSGMLIVNPNKAQKLYLDEVEVGKFMTFDGGITLSTAVQANASTIKDETVWVLEISARDGILYLKTLIKPTETSINSYKLHFGAAKDAILTVYGNKMSIGADPNTNIKRVDIYSTNDTNISIISTASNNVGQISASGETPKISFPVSGINGSSLALVPEFEISMTQIYGI
jgi:hypothetical protein